MFVYLLMLWTCCCSKKEDLCPRALCPTDVSRGLCTASQLPAASTVSIVSIVVLLGASRSATRVYLRLLASHCGSRFLMIFWHRLGTPISADFGANLAPIWPPTWSQNRSKIIPRALRNPSQIASCFRSLLGSILDRFSIDFRAQNQSKIEQKSINKSSQQHNNQKSKKCQKRNTYATFGTSAMLL